MPEEFTFPDDEKPVIRPVRIQGFSRYDIYPEGRIIDTHTQKAIVFNKHLNFAWYPDGEDKPVFDNIRNLIRDLVKQKIPGFDKELPAYRPPDLYEELRFKMEAPELAKPKELHFLRKELNESSNELLSDVFNLTKQTRYKKASDAIEFFKQNNPSYYKWPIWAEVPIPLEPEETKALLKEYEELLQEEAEIIRQIRVVSSRLRGVLEILEFNAKTKNGLGADFVKP